MTKTNPIYKRYAQKHENGELHNVYDNPLVYRSGLVCEPDEDIFRITFVECEEKDHDMVAWQKTDSNNISMIFASKLLLTVCFPYGINAEINAGKGHIVYLKTISCEYAGKAKDLKEQKDEKMKIEPILIGNDGTPIFTDMTIHAKIRYLNKKPFMVCARVNEIDMDSKTLTIANTPYELRHIEQLIADHSEHNVNILQQKQIALQEIIERIGIPF